MLSFNTTIRKIHLWLGLTCGLIASFSGLTGSLYVWQPEITAALNPELLKVENVENIKEVTILKSVVSLIETHKDSLNKIFLPYREQQTIAIQFKNGKTNYYHPVTSEFLGEKSASISFFENLLNLHRTLGIPQIGKYIIGTSAIIFFIILITSGVYIWWKAYANNLKKGFKVKWKAKKKKFNFDLHKALGIYFFIPLIIIAFTGSYFTYNAVYKSALKVFDNPNTHLINQQKNKNFSTLNETLLNSNEKYALRAIYFPKDKSGMYRIRYIKDRFIKAGYRKTKEVEINEKGDITTLSDFRFDSNSNRIVAQFYPIHIGEIAGICGRILVFISGMVPLVLLITGFRIYRLKKNKGLKKK
ncbi:PepSY-associated TM helix domain-containing protein [Mariniflexile sp. HMF6888]|uniref:PepSY-associated TM helix domain-containing protein n=1 Tax=Mariniflexile sp. HMF6888 TaxID=3373086 RepID=UPI0037B46ECD